MSKSVLSCIFLSLFLFCSKNYSIQIDQSWFSKETFEPVLQYKKSTIASMILVPLAYQLYKKSNKRIIEGKKIVYEEEAICSIYNQDKAQEHLIFFFQGHKGFAQFGVEQSAYKGEMLSEQLEQKQKDLEISDKIINSFCEVAPRFEETILNLEYRTYFGQSGDVLRALECIKENHHLNDKKINIVGRSRGGYVLANVLAVLCTKNHPFLKTAGIDETEREKIVKKLKKGFVLFVVPLIDMRWTLWERSGHVVGMLEYFIFLPIISVFRHNPFAISALEALNRTNTHDTFKIKVIFVDDDKSVGKNPKIRNMFINMLNARVAKRKEDQEIGNVDVEHVSGDHNGKEQQNAMLQSIINNILEKQ